MTIEELCDRRSHRVPLSTNELMVIAFALRDYASAKASSEFNKEFGERAKAILTRLDKKYHLFSHG